MNFAIKQLTQSDAATLKELNIVFADVFKDRESYASKPPSEEYLSRLLGKDTCIALAVFDGDMVIGGVTAYVLEKFEQERKEIYLYDLAVLKAYRRQGIATALINKLKDIAKEIGAYVIYVQADHGDDAAIALYESFGKKEEVFHFDIEL
jgi:aminoglycoside 3-N-acetyltransferase I